MRFEPRLLALRTDGGEAGLLLPAGAASCLRSLWRLHRNEPGWFVEEHMQDRRLLVEAEDETLTVEEEDEALTDLLGERVAPPPASLMRVGEAER
jgi:hypothetical protein